MIWFASVVVAAVAGVLLGIFLLANADYPKPGQVAVTLRDCTIGEAGSYQLVFHKNGLLKIADPAWPPDTGKARVKWVAGVVVRDGKQKLHTLYGDPEATAFYLPGDTPVRLVEVMYRPIDPKWNSLPAWMNEAMKT